MEGEGPWLLKAINVMMLLLTEVEEFGVGGRGGAKWNVTVNILHKNKQLNCDCHVFPTSTAVPELKIGWFWTKPSHSLLAHILSSWWEIPGTIKWSKLFSFECRNQIQSTWLTGQWIRSSPHGCRVNESDPVHMVVGSMNQIQSTWLSGQWKLVQKEAGLTAQSRTLCWHYCCVGRSCRAFAASKPSRLLAHSIIYGNT